MSRQDSLFGRVFLYRHGRLAALVVLSVFALLLAAAAWREQAEPQQTSGQRVLFAVAAPLAGVRQLLFDGYRRMIPRTRVAQPVALVGIDENSLKQFGQ
jgi:hypothetical protein